MKKELIAPCGMNCGLCYAYHRVEKHCPGCRNGVTMPSCVKCSKKLCDKRSGEYCFQCAIFPCVKLKQLDKRYRTKYEMSMIENLEIIRDHGMESFLKREDSRWVTAEGVYCVHTKKRILINEVDQETQKLDKKFVEYVALQMQDAVDISYKYMFGGCAIYFDNKVVALVCNNKLYVKPTEGGRKFIKNVCEESPYPGAKPHFLIDDKIDDKEWLCQLIRITADELLQNKKNK